MSDNTNTSCIGCITVILFCVVVYQNFIKGEDSKIDMCREYTNSVCANYASNYCENYIENNQDEVCDDYCDENESQYCDDYCEDDYEK